MVQVSHDRNLRTILPIYHPNPKFLVIGHVGHVEKACGDACKVACGSNI